jgi:hypothetical protein
MGFFSSDGKGSFTGPKKAEAPPPPDFAGLAKQQGQINKDTALFNAGLAHVNQSNPYGSIGYKHEMGADGNPVTSMSTTLSPQQQALFDAQQRNKLSLITGKQTGIGAVDNYFSQAQGAGLQGSGEDARKAMVDAVYGQYAAKLDPRYQQEERQPENRLVQQGITPGSAAYDTQMSNFRRNRDEAYQGASNQAVIQGDASQNQAFAQAMAKHQQAQQDYSQYMNNTAPVMPTQLSTNGGGGAAAADMAGAGADQYKAALGQTNAANANQSNQAQGAATLASLAISFF